jgi:isoleucyl-tRNA synthetase
MAGYQALYVPGDCHGLIEHQVLKELKTRKTSIPGHPPICREYAEKFYTIQRGVSVWHLGD